MRYRRHALCCTFHLFQGRSTVLVAMVSKQGLIFCKAMRPLVSAYRIDLDPTDVLLLPCQASYKLFLMYNTHVEAKHRH